jgi:hypothetical protein
VPPGAAFHATTVPPTSTSVLSPVPAAAERTVDPPAPAAADNGVPPPVDPVALASPISSRAEPGDGTGRRRRFVLPRLDEDRARSDRAIAAVLGEIDTSGVTRPAVRRQRSRRVTGEPVPHTEVLLADMTRYAADFMYALARAMEQCTRDTDRVQVLPDGSVRLVLEADDVGAGAFVQRARELLGPWLQFAGASVEFRVRPLAPVGSALGIGEPSARDR